MEVPEAPHDGQFEVGRGLIQIEGADGQGSRRDGGLAMADQGSPSRLLESQGGQLAGWPILPQGHATGIDPIGLRRVVRGAMDTGELPEPLAPPLATPSLFVDDFEASVRVFSARSSKGCAFSGSRRSASTHASRISAAPSRHLERFIAGRLGAHRSRRLRASENDRAGGRVAGMALDVPPNVESARARSRR